jgi:hypothetical protein
MNTNITRQLGKPNEAWIERPEQAGIYFVGFADDVAPRAVRHRGWFTDDDCGDVMRGMVFRFAGRRGAFVAGRSDPWNDGPAYIDLSPIDDERDAAMAADSLAECHAEAEREYQESERAKMHADDFVESYQDAD